MQRLSRYSSTSQPCSTGTWGRNSPVRPMKRISRPSRPMVTDPDMRSGPPCIGTGGVRIVTSTVMRSSSDARRSGNLGS